MAEADILKNDKNRDISATVWPIFTKFGTMMLNGSLNCSYRENFWISIIRDRGWPPFWKQLNRNISATIWPISMTFGTMIHIGSRAWHKFRFFFKFSTILYGGQPLSWESKNCLTVFCNYTITYYTILSIKHQVLMLKTAVYPSC